MALTASAKQGISPANISIVTGTLNLGASYATGGVAVAASQIGLSNIFQMDVAPSGGFVFEYVPTGASGGVVKAYETGAALSGVLAEAANAANMSAINPRFTAFGN